MQLSPPLGSGGSFLLQPEHWMFHMEKYSVYIYTTYSCCQAQITKSNFRGKSKVKVHYHLSKAQTESAARELQTVFQHWPHTLNCTALGLAFQLLFLCSKDWDVFEQGQEDVEFLRPEDRVSLSAIEAEVGQPSKLPRGDRHRQILISARPRVRFISVTAGGTPATLSAGKQT